MNYKHDTMCLLTTTILHLLAFALYAAAEWPPSALVQVDKKTVSLFYETRHYRDIRMMRIPIKELLKSSRKRFK